MRKKYTVAISVVVCLCIIFAAVPCIAKHDGGDTPGFTLTDNALSVTGTATMPAGTYYFTSMSISGTLNVTGSAVIYCTGDISTSGNGIVNSATPLGLIIYCTGTSVTMGGTSDFVGCLFAADATVNMHGTPGYYGSIVANDLDLRGTADVHYDEALQSAGAPQSSGYAVSSWIEK